MPLHRWSRTSGGRLAHSYKASQSASQPATLFPAFNTDYKPIPSLTIPESADGHLCHGNTSTALLQPAASTETANAASTGSTTGATNAHVPSVSSAFDATKQAATGTAPAYTFLPGISFAAAANAAHAATARSCATTRYATIAGPYAASDSCSGSGRCGWSCGRQRGA